MVSFNLPMMKLMGDQVHLEMTPLRPYEGFANDVSKLLGANSPDYQDLDPVPKAGLFYWLTFTIEYDGNSSFWFLNFYIICLFVSLNFRLFLCSLSGIARRTSLRSFGRGSQNDIHLVPILT